MLFCLLQRKYYSRYVKLMVLRTIKVVQHVILLVNILQEHLILLMNTIGLNSLLIKFLFICLWLVVGVHRIQIIPIFVNCFSKLLPLVDLNQGCFHNINDWHLNVSVIQLVKVLGFFILSIRYKSFRTKEEITLSLSCYSCLIVQQHRLVI